MKTLKVPNYTFLTTVPLTDEILSKIQYFSRELGYNLSLNDCRNLWLMYSEAIYEDNPTVNTENVKKAIKYIEHGVIWNI